jgi:hypothetical protein
MHIHIIRIGTIVAAVGITWRTAIVMMEVVAVRRANGEIVMVINRVTPSIVVTEIRTIVKWAIVKV